MTTLTKKQLADALEEELIAARDAYHTDGTSPLSDEEYDRKLLLLKPLRPDSELFTQVGAPVRSGTLVKHAAPIGSQEKLKDVEELQAWDKKVPNSLIKYAVQWKLDGLTVVATYKDGLLVHAVTRGDGHQGEDITRNVRYMQNVRTKVTGKFSGYLRGELLLPISAFKQHFQPQGFKNPRNTAAGKARDLKADPELLKHFEISWFDVVPDSSWLKTPLPTVSEAMSLIENLGMEPTDTTLVETADDVWGVYQTMARLRGENDFEADGVVVKVNDLVVQAKMGMSSSLCPHGQRCIKFAAAGNVTKVLGVTHSIGHTGELFPTAVLAPVEINGVTIQSCTLHNYEEVKRLDVAIGDEVEVIRAGDVIPKIVRMTARGKDREPITAPKKCPSCGERTKVEGQHVFCRALDCPGREARVLRTWVKKRDIKWLGEEIVEVLYDSGVLTPSQLYSVTRDQLAALTLKDRKIGSGADRIMEELEKSKQCSLSDFMGSLGIESMGRREAQNMIEACDLETVDDFLNLKKERLLQAKGFGEVKADKILAGIAGATAEIKRLLEVITIVDTTEETHVVAKKTTGTGASGKTFCFTGALPSGQTRAQATADLEAAGGIAVDSVRAGLDYLVIADPASTSSKAKKARELGVTLIDEAAFRSMLK